MKIPQLQDCLNILFDRYWNGPIDIYNNKEEAQSFISRLINVGIEADEKEEHAACKEAFIALWSKKDKLIAEREFSWFWLNYWPKFVSKKSNMKHVKKHLFF